MILVFHFLCLSNIGREKVFPNVLDRLLKHLFIKRAKFAFFEWGKSTFFVENERFIQVLILRKIHRRSLRKQAFLDNKSMDLGTPQNWHLFKLKCLVHDFGFSFFVFIKHRSRKSVS